LLSGFTYQASPFCSTCKRIRPATRSATEAAWTGKGLITRFRENDFTIFEYKEFNDKGYLVKTFGGPYGGYREYSTFIGDTKVDIWIDVEKNTSPEESDKFFTQFKIEEL